MQDIAIEAADVSAADLARLVGITVKEVHTYVRLGKLPKPDVAITTRQKRWKRSTIAAFLGGGGRQVIDGV